MKALTRQQVESFHYDGFLFPVPALTPTEIATCLAGLERLEIELGCGDASFLVEYAGRRSNSVGYRFQRHHCRRFHEGK